MDSVEARGSSFLRGAAIVVTTVVLAALASGCIEWSPFESDLPDDERDQNARNLARLMTSPPRQGPLRFAAVSDSHQAYDSLSAVLDAIEARDDVEFVLHLGDLTEQGLRQEYRWTLESLRRLDVPFFVAIGNHDTLSNGRHVYREMFGRYDFSFEHRGVRIVVLNTNQLEFDGAAPNLDWLAQETAPSTDTRAVVVAGHQRPVSDDYQDVLRDNEVDALVTAHLHRTEAETLEGVPAFMIGSTQLHAWSLFTVEGDTVTVANCVSERCEEVEP